MTWTLAIDFGTTATAAAIYDGDVELIQVDGLARLPSLVLLGSDGTPVCGAAAERQAAGAPERVERTPKRRLGDRLLLLGDQAVDPVDLVAAVLQKVAEEARRQQGGTAPDHVVLTHPAAWVGARLAALREASRRAGLGEATLMPEPVAAAVHLADDRIAVGDHVAVYDLGGGTFDAAILRRTAGGFEPVGAPGGDEHLGGEDFDELLYQAVGDVLEARDPERWQLLSSSEERSWLRANAVLRDDVRAAKEALSSTPDYTIYIPVLDEEVRVTREQVEELVRPSLERSVDELVATVERAGLRVSDVKAVYLVGGSSRIPLAARLISERTGLVPLTWGDPKSAVALGAAQRAGSVDVSPVVLRAPDASLPETDAGAAAISPDVAAVPMDTVVPDPPQKRARTLVLSGVALAIVVVLVALVSLGGDDDGGEAAGSTTTTSTTSTTIGPNGEIEFTFPATDREGVQYARVWRHDPTADTLVSELTLTTTGAPSAEIFEVVPKEVASDVSLITFDPQPAEVIAADPVVRHVVEFTGGAPATLRWTVATPADLDADAIKKLATARDAAEDSFLASRGEPVATETTAPPSNEELVIGPRSTTTTARALSGGGSSSGTSGGSVGSGTGGTDGGGVAGGATSDDEPTATPTPAGETATTSTTASPTQPGVTTATTVGRTVAAPSVVNSPLSRDPEGLDFASGVATKVRVTLQWSPPSDDGGQAPTAYKIKCTTMQGSGPYNGADYVPCKGGLDHSTTSGSATSASVVADRIDPGPGTWMKWEIAAVNSGGTGAYRTVQVLVPSVLGLYSWEAWPIVRIVGLDAGGGFATTCGRQPGQMCTQSRVAGSTIASGLSFTMSEQQS